MLKFFIFYLISCCFSFGAVFSFEQGTNLTSSYDISQTINVEFNNYGNYGLLTLSNSGIGSINDIYINSSNTTSISLVSQVGANFSLTGNPARPPNNISSFTYTHSLESSAPQKVSGLENGDSLTFRMNYGGFQNFNLAVGANLPDKKIDGYIANIPEPSFSLLGIISTVLFCFRRFRK